MLVTPLLRPEMNERVVDFDPMLRTFPEPPARERILRFVIMEQHPLTAQDRGSIGDPAPPEE
jgi:hypothetical protein